MTIHEIQIALEAAATAGLAVTRYGGNYSGRGMYGESTGAVVVEAPRRNALHLMLAMAAATGDPKLYRTDDLGRDTIVY